MKYGIDINDKDILKGVIDYLKNTGEFIVNLSDEDINSNNINHGKILRKKVLKANVTNIDFFIKVEFLEEVSDNYIYFSLNENVDKIINNICEILIKKSIIISKKDGSILYLLKNINSPGIVIKVSKKSMEELNLDIVKEILKVIKSINE